MFGSSIFPTNSITQITSGITNAISNNIGVILGIVAFIVGLSVIMALIDSYLAGSVLDRYEKIWKKDGWLK